MNRDEMLREMGLTPIWRLREQTGAAVGTATAPVPAPASAPASKPVADATPSLPGAADASSVAVVAKVVPALASAGPRPAVDMATAAGSGSAAAAPEIAVGPERGAKIAALEWDQLVAATASCRACGLCKQRKQAVFGVGDRHPDWLFIGEGPGEQEDARGEPFVGPAGQLLDAMLAAIDLERGKGVYIANAVKCRPPSNRTPTPEEMAACRPFLRRQIALLQPKLLVLLGKAAVHSVLDLDSPLSGLRGKVHSVGQIPVVVTYHPAYLLRSLTEKAKAWEDLCLARRVLRDS